MIRRCPRLPLVLLAFTLAASTPLGAAGAATSAATDAVTTEDLVWLAGCWAADGGEPGSVEQWTAPAGGTLLGVSRTIKGGETVFHEFLIIRDTAEGLEYVASPAGQATTSFRAEAVGDGHASFFNPQHDFPQRIVYRRDGERLVARIEGTTEKGEQGVDFGFVRVPCDAPLPLEDTP